MVCVVEIGAIEAFCFSLLVYFAFWGILAHILWLMKKFGKKELE